MQPGWSHPQHSRQAEAPEPAPTPLLSQPAMERRAEINRFAIFLFCLLVPFGSLAPTETSESKLTTGERQKRFTTDIQSHMAVIQDRAHDLFEFYHNCVSATFPPKSQMIMYKPKDMADTIPECPVFHANCCALHHIQNILQTLESHIETICNESSKVIVTANLGQLDTTLSRGTTFHTCKVNPPQVQNMGLADRKTYIWWVLKRYEDIMQTAVNLYSEPAV